MSACSTLHLQYQEYQQYGRWIALEMNGSEVILGRGKCLNFVFSISSPAGNGKGNAHRRVVVRGWVQVVRQLI
jgi:hypothetical protein